MIVNNKKTLKMYSCIMLAWIVLICIFGNIYGIPPDLNNFRFIPKNVSFNPIKLIFSNKEIIQSSQCGAALLQGLTNMSSPQGKNMLLYSGKKLNDIGNYFQCSSSTQSHYIICLIPFVFYPRIGLCLPKECQIESLEKLKPFIIPIMSKIVGFSVPDNYLQFIDVSRKDENLHEKKGGYFVFWIITALLLGLAIIATILCNCKIIKPEGVEQGGILKFLQCFCLQRSIRGLFSTENRVDPNLDVLNGLRVLGMGWVILSHGCSSEVIAPVFNAFEAINLYVQEYRYSYILSGFLAVDIFFLLSGFLSAMGFMSLITRKFNYKSILLAYLYRYLRLLPLLGFSLLFILFVIPTLNTNIAGYHFEKTYDICAKNWHKTLFYYGNFSAFSDICLQWTWYLMNDMQFYLLTPLVLLPFKYSYKLGLIILGSILGGFISCSIFIHAYYELHSAYTKPAVNDFYTLYYEKPYCRISVYFIGIFGYLLYREYKNNLGSPLKCVIKLYQKPAVKYIGYIVGVVLIYLITHLIYFFNKYPLDFSQATATFYEVFHRPLFALAILLLILPTLFNDGQFVRSVLGHPIFAPIAKLTYGAYMIHLKVFYLCSINSMSGWYTNDSILWFHIFMVYFLSYFISLLATLVFESPSIQLLKVYLVNALQSSPKKAG